MARKQRREDRQHTLLAGRMIFNDGKSTLDCVIRDLSEHGAHLWLPTVVGAPHRFDLLIPHDGRRLPAVVAWHDGRSLGVDFEVAERSDPGPDQVTAAG
ncbi:MAG: PilZ domain-containing protein [Alphaproteobacteria bacterium]